MTKVEAISTLILGLTQDEINELDEILNAQDESRNVRTNEAKEKKCYRVNKWPTCPHEVNELDCHDCTCYF